MRAIDADDLKTAFPACDNSKPVLIASVRATINHMPTIEPEPHWIPCSERLPDKPNVYTVTDHEGRVVRYVYNDNESSREYWKRCAKAWMPLPEPYREGEGCF